MNTRTTTAPTVEPLTLAETKVHLREDLTDAGNDALITSLIAVARQACEHRVQRALMLQTLEATLDAFPCASARNPDAAIELIMPPVIDVTSVTYTAANSSATVLASTDYTLDARSEPARLIHKILLREKPSGPCGPRAFCTAAHPFTTPDRSPPWQKTPKWPTPPSTRRPTRWPRC